MRDHKSPSRGNTSRGVREHIGPRPFVRLPVRPVAAAAPDVLEPYDLPPAHISSDAR